MSLDNSKNLKPETLKALAKMGKLLAKQSEQIRF
jgi:hypothetical protein